MMAAGASVVCLGTQQRQPHVPAHVVNQQQEVGVSGRCVWRDRATKVSMDQLELLLSSVLGGLGERLPLLFCQDAVLANLVDMIDRWQSAYHAAAFQLAKCLEVDVAIPLVPTPRHIPDARSEAHRSGDVHVEEVEPVW